MYLFNFWKYPPSMNAPSHWLSDTIILYLSSPEVRDAATFV